MPHSVAPRRVQASTGMGGWVLPHITPVSWVGLTATKQPIGIGVGLQGHTPLPAARSSPLVGPTLGCPHAPACLPPASLLELPTSVITPRPYLPSFIIAVSRPFRTSSQSLEPCKYYCTSSLSFCTPFSCPRHGAVWSETACRLSTRAIYRESHNPIIVGHDCLPPCVFSWALARVDAPCLAFCHAPH